MNLAVNHTYEVRFARGHELRFIGHLDLMRVWERMLRRAQVPVVYSQGFNPRPSLTFAAPLPVGVMSQGDLLELDLEEPLGVSALLSALSGQAVRGLTVEGVSSVSGRRRSLPARMLEAEYDILLHDVDRQAATRAVEALLAAPNVPVRVDRGQRTRQFDLRPLVLGLSAPAPDPAIRVRARLRHSPEATGRPDDLLRALGFDPARAEITRVRLLLAP